MMSNTYRAMVYSGVGIMYFYRDYVLPYNPGETLGQFADKNKVIVDRVIEEVKNTFHYELSHAQVGMILGAYVSPSSNLNEPTSAVA